MGLFRHPKLPSGVTRYKTPGKGYASHVSNRHDGKQYSVSTVQVRPGLWQTAVALTVKGFGDFKRPLFIKNSHSYKAATSLHKSTELMVLSEERNKWPDLPLHTTSYEI